MNPIVHTIYQSIVEGDRAQAKAKVEEALSAGLEAGTILQEGLVAPMDEVGRLFEQGEYFVPEMLVAARAMQESLAILKPHLAQANVQSAGKIVIGTVKGDLHDIGKNLVAMMLEGGGFEIVDLGVDVAPDKFVAVLQAERPDILALSALLTTTMPNMPATIAAVKAAGLDGSVKVIVGGAPVTEAYAQQIGADGYAPDASRVVALARSLVSA